MGTPWTYFLHLSLSSVILTDSSKVSPVHVLMSIQAVCGLPRLRAPGIVQGVRTRVSEHHHRTAATATRRGRRRYVLFAQHAVCFQRVRLCVRVHSAPGLPSCKLVEVFLELVVLFYYKIKPKIPLYFSIKSRIFSHPHRISSLSSLWRPLAMADYNRLSVCQPTLQPWGPVPPGEN